MDFESILEEILLGSGQGSLNLSRNRKKRYNGRDCLKIVGAIGLLQLAITWYKIGHAGGQAHYYSRYGTLKQRDLNQ